MTAVPFLRLSIMMFFQYAVWGAWLPLAGRYLSAPEASGGLGFSGYQIGLILGLAGSIGAVAAPFVAGQLADRYFRTERCLAVLLLCGGMVKWYTAYQTGFNDWLWLSILYSVIYMPTLSLSNSLAFAHLEHGDDQFGKIRVWGTIGWIAASWVFPMIWLQTNLSFQAMPPFLVGSEVPQVTSKLADALKFSGLISFVYAAFCLLLLPKTPPKKDADEKLAVTKAFRLFLKPSFSVLVLASLAISVIHQIYFIQAGPFLSAIGLQDSEIGPAMSIGQFAEIAFMAGLGVCLKRLGFRRVISIGCFAYCLRYLVFGSVGLPVWLIVSSQVLHGLCYACFFAAGFIYVDRIAAKDVRHSAQTVFGIIILGGGPVLGGYLQGFLVQQYTLPAGGVDFSSLWYTLSAIGLVTTIGFAALFKEEMQTESKEPGAVASS